MTFIEALEAYHNGKSIRRKCWERSDAFNKTNKNFPDTSFYEGEDYEYSKYSVMWWDDLLADDWIAEDE